MQSMFKQLILTTIIVSCATVAEAQRRTDRKAIDTTRPGTVVITSAYKPELKTAAKITFSAAAPTKDSAKPSLNYVIPSQNLFFSYQPMPLQPLALEPDSAAEWRNSNYVKAGYGNFRTPYLETALSFGSSEASLAAFAKHISSKSSLPFQQFGRTQVELIGSLANMLDHQWTAKAYFQNRSHYQYGFDAAKWMFSPDSLRRRFNTFGIGGGVKNASVNDYGITYNPSFELNFHSDNRSARETNFLLDLPVEKALTKVFSLHLAVNVDVTSYRSDSASQSNNFFYVQPLVSYNTPNLLIKGGFTPAWDNSEFRLMPHLTAEAKLAEGGFKVMAGWVGRLVKNNYRSLSTLNPFIEEPRMLANTRMNEIYAGLRGSAGNHFSYSARLAFVNFHNQPLFLNDTLAGNKFVTAFEPKLKAMRVHAEVGYTLQEKFSAVAGLTFNQYSGLEINDKAWHLPPVELSAALRWKVLRDLMVRSDLYFFEGPQYFEKTGIGTFSTAKLKPGIDLNLGAEFTVLPKLNVWVQFNNVFNNRYMRWNQYEVLGFQVVGGLSYSFGDLSKMITSK